MPVIGYLDGHSRVDDAPFLAAFLRGLGETGFVEGRNVRIEYRHAEYRDELLPALAADLVEHRAAVIAAPAPAIFVPQPERLSKSIAGRARPLA